MGVGGSQEWGLPNNLGERNFLRKVKWVMELGWGDNFRKTEKGEKTVVFPFALATGDCFSRLTYEKGQHEGYH